MCIHPFKKKINPEDEEVTPLSCGNCHECLKHRAADWAFRVKNELSMHDESAYITLTYNEDSKHDLAAYTYYDFQLFLKKLRNYHKKKISHFTSVEYGSKNGRLHFHTIIFGYYPRNPQFERMSPSGYPLYTETQQFNKTHKPLSQLWEHGFHSFAPATVETAYYIASYALKSNITVNQDGEIFSDQLKTSRNPAIGLTYFHLHYNQLVAQAMFHNLRLPRYYEKKLEEFYQTSYEIYQMHFESNQINRTNNFDELARLKTHMSQQFDTTYRRNKDLQKSIDALTLIEEYRKK